mmetsp:Transcript_25368/g.50928  ORF Transcript_25368/g.50928 Transcript_25368/m.50928 type:complete len:126 (-) Transcript_25368:808-1185(-)
MGVVEAEELTLDACAALVPAAAGAESCSRGVRNNGGAELTPAATVGFIGHTPATNEKEEEAAAAAPIAFESAVFVVAVAGSSSGKTEVPAAVKVEEEEARLLFPPPTTSSSPYRLSRHRSTCAFA